MYAIIQTGGKQYKVQEGDTIDVERLGAETGSECQFDVLMVVDKKGVQMGEPTVSDYQVVGEIIGDTAGPKIDIAVYKRRQGYQRRLGHRQLYSQVKIKGIKSSQKKGAN